MKLATLFTEKITKMINLGDMIQIEFGNGGWLVSREFALNYLLMRKMFETEPRTRKMEN